MAGRGVPGGVVGGVLGGLPAPGRQNAYREAEIDRSSARFHTEAYDLIQDNPFLAAAQNPLSTFSIDVDTASYANVRRFLVQGQLPPKDAVRIEELLNYFRYDYPEPTRRDAVLGLDRGRRVPVAAGAPAGARRPARALDRGRGRAAAPAHVPDRRLRLDDASRQAAAAQAGDGAAGRGPARAGPRRDRGLRRQLGPRAAADLGRPPGGDPGGARLARGGRLDGGRRRASSSPTASRPRCTSRAASTA